MSKENIGWRERFDTEFKCIQSGCDGEGNIPRMVSGQNGNDYWEAEQCEFHAKYLFPLKAFIAEVEAAAEERGADRIWSARLEDFTSGQ